MIVWLASFPRSGNGFFRVVSRRLFGREIWSIYDEKKMPVDSSELARMQKDNETYLVKTHEMPSDSNQAIYLVRDGRDSLVSLTWFYLTSQADPEKEIPEKIFHKALKKHILSDVFGGWSNNVLA